MAALPPVCPETTTWLRTHGLSDQDFHALHTAFDRLRDSGIPPRRALEDALIALREKRDSERVG